MIPARLGRLPPDPMVPVPAEITRVIRETPDTLTFHLRPEAPLPFVPGQFDMLYLPGAGEVPISLSGDPEAAGEAVHTLRAVGEVSAAMHSLGRGDVLGLRGPYGNGWPVGEARGRDLVLVAGGLGLAPLRPVVYHALRHRDRYRRVALCYGARTPDDLLYRRELARWERQGVAVRTTVDRRRPGWSGRVGVVTGLFEDLDLDARDAVALMCGPEAMVRFAARDLARLGLPPDRVFVALERNMKCGVGLCGHCRYGPYLVCRDGPVFRLDRIEDLLRVRDL